MNMTTLCKSLNHSQLMIEVMGKLELAFDHAGIMISNNETHPTYGDLEIVLSTKSVKEGCHLSVTHNRIHISPIAEFGNDRADFKLELTAEKNAEEWSIIAMAFIVDALQTKGSEWCFEVFNEDGDLIYDSFKTKYLTHALNKVQNLNTLRNIDSNDVYEVLINMDNETDGDVQLIYKRQEDFFCLCDRNLSNNDLILALTLINANYPSATYSIRQNRFLGVEI